MDQANEDKFKLEAESHLSIPEQINISGKLLYCAGTRTERKGSPTKLTFVKPPMTELAIELIKLFKSSDESEEIKQFVAKMVSRVIRADAPNKAESEQKIVDAIREATYEVCCFIDKITKSGWNSGRDLRTDICE